MRALIWIVALGVFLVNPAAGCTSDSSDDYRFGDTEMRAAVEGDWTATMSFGGGGPQVVTVRLQQASGPAQAINVEHTRDSAKRPSGRSFVRSAAACGVRTLVRLAAACISSTLMPLDGAFVEGDEAFRVASIEATFRIDGLIVGPGDLDLAFDTGVLIHAVLSPDGHVADASVSDGTGPGVVTFVRVAP